MSDGNTAVRLPPLTSHNTFTPLDKKSVKGTQTEHNLLAAFAG